MNIDKLQQTWLIPKPWRLHPIAQGVNNQTQVVETPTGRFILRAYGSDRSLEHIRYELEVLRVLQGKILPFQVPSPVPTANSEPFAILDGTVTTLTRWLSGSIPSGDNLQQALTAGQSLAELVDVLADIQMNTSSQISPFPPSGDFDGWAGVPIDPVQTIKDLPLTKEDKKRILTLLEETQAVTIPLYQTLPQQIIHRDYDQSNILMNGNSVTGVLDFEFCGYDLRILDLTYALSKWPAGLWGTGKEWEVLDYFGRGYLKRQKILSEELEAIPSVLRLRAITSLFFRFGRYAQGLETQEDMFEQIQEKLKDEAWLQTNEMKLLQHARNWRA